MTHAAYSLGNKINRFFSVTWVTETEKGRLTCSIISMTFISLNILGPITVRRVEKVNVFIIVTSQELCQEQEHSSEGKG